MTIRNYSIYVLTSRVFQRKIHIPNFWRAFFPVNDPVESKFRPANTTNPLTVPIQFLKTFRYVQNQRYTNALTHKSKTK